MKFTKMEGIGNDYIYIDNRDHFFDYDPAFITKISDRHMGIGADGLIALENSDKYDFKMRMFNADGSEGQMCGNGIRCLAKFAYDNKLTDKTHLEFETKAGKRIVDLILEDGQVTGATVDMGVPSSKVKDLPMVYDAEECINGEFVVGGKRYRGTAISVGNPHIVMFTKHLPEDIETDGFKIEHSGVFPEKVNVEFVEVIDRNHLKMRVWERGSGETLACGTGACATVYAAILENKIDTTCDVELLGGHLSITYRDGHLFMTGQARTTFIGEVMEENYVR
ncbi:diaminopimelate epimerase [Sharpea azabuensis]|uniref:Diaminopimelate epimerase n=1 Tax=Sharpea azabuensis TaxID=322505 RepID=A0A1H6SZH1_9FIRM|nr:diaminopimelate epimerase [Sharpea azabuensis]SEI69365.1 diaminopimelate epimerase [Sharpea azabuensis]HCJ14857.1 diaminopimelate epimerase [Erysipelotrichaceae bacterium]